LKKTIGMEGCDNAALHRITCRRSGYGKRAEPDYFLMRENTKGVLNALSRAFVSCVADAMHSIQRK
jgi:hypothetical protein